MDFNESAGDKLDLSELLVGVSANAASLDVYLDFSFSDGNTTIGVRTSGGSGGYDQQIVLQNVDLTANNTLTDSQILTNLLTTGTLLVD